MSFEEYNKTFLYAKTNNSEACYRSIKSNEESANSIYRYMWGDTEFLLIGTLKNNKSSTVLKKLNIPCLFLAGDNDEVSFDSLSFYKNLIKREDSKVIIYENSNHSVNIDSEERIVLDVKDFILNK